MTEESVDVALLNEAVVPPGLESIYRIERNQGNWLNPSFVAKSLEGGECTDGARPQLAQRKVGWLRHQGVFGNGHIFRESAFAPPEHFVTLLKLVSVLADRLNVACHIKSGNSIPWFEQPGTQASDEWQASHEVPIITGHARGVNTHQHLAILESHGA